jgi:hypothetical protein
MISRIWHGYTSLDNADKYEQLLKKEIFVGISNRKIDGYKGIQLLRRKLGHEVEFITIMWFDTIASVKLFAGKEYELAVVPNEARKLLTRFDERAQHYEVRTNDFIQM